MRPKSQKMALQTTTSKVDVQDITKMLVIKHRQLNRAATREQKVREKENLEKDAMNAPIILSPGNISKKRKRDDILGGNSMSC